MAMTRGVQPARPKENPPAYAPCTHCGVEVLTGLTPEGTALALDVGTASYIVDWTAGRHKGGTIMACPKCGATEIDILECTSVTHRKWVAGNTARRYDNRVERREWLEAHCAACGVTIHIKDIVSPASAMDNISSTGNSWH